MNAGPFASIEDAERTERGLKGRALVEKYYSWDRLAVTVNELCS